MQLNNLLNIANEAAAVETDMSQASKGGGGSSHVFPVGYAFARLVEVIELGEHRIEYQGELKAPAPQVRLGFALYGEGYTFGEEQKPGLLRTFELALSNNEKAKAFKLFKKLNYKGTAKTFAQLLNEPYLLKVVHAMKDGKPTARIDLEGFLPPTDPVTKAPYQIPQVSNDMFKLFLWNSATQEQWDSLYQEGVYPSGMSKNFLQERCLAAENFPGSKLEALLGGAGIPSLEMPTCQPADEVPEAPTRKTKHVA